VCERDVLRRSPTTGIAGRAAEQRDELAALHSITSSARASSVAGTSRPNALAVLRLITNSNLVGCSTGISAGFAPRRTLFTTSAARLHMFGQYGPKEIRPPISTGSRTVYIVGSRAVSAKILMRIRFTKKIGLAGTYNACALPWS